MERGRRVALLPVRPEPEDARALAVGPAPARSLPRPAHRDLRGRAQEGRPLPVPAAGRAPPGGAEEGRGEEGGSEKEEPRRRRRAATSPPRRRRTRTRPRPRRRPSPCVIDLDGLSARLYKVPVPAGRFGSLQTDGKRLYWLSVDDSPEQKRRLQALAIGREKPDVKTVMDGVAEFQLSADDKKLLVRKEKENDLYVFDAGDKAPEKLDESKVDLSRWTLQLRPPRAVAPDVRGGVAPRARLLLRPRHARPRLAEGPGEVRAARRPRDAAAAS